MRKNILFVVVALVVIFVVGGFSGVFFERVIIPKIASNATFSKFEMFQKATDNVTIVERTEQIVVREDDSVNRVAAQAATSVVDLISVAADSTGDGMITQLGTGVILTGDGYIVTSQESVLGDAESFHVLLFDGREYEASVLGTDPYSDLAFLKIEETNLPAIAIANSDDVSPGRKLIAIGNASGDYQNRFAAGLLSHVNYTFNLSPSILASSEKLSGVFETDFNEQEAYLGGPVVDFNSELLGITSAVVRQEEKIFFQVPSNVVRDALDRLIDGSLESRPVLGVTYVPLTKAYAISHDVPKDRGALITSPSGRQNTAILSNSVAEKAGIEVGDIIVSVSAQPVTLSDSLPELISRHKVGDEVIFDVLRGDEELAITLTF